LSQSEYHRETGLIVDSDLAIDLPEKISRGHIDAAVESLREVVCDFPFESPVHQAAWFAALLTPLARFAFNGPAPLFLFDANTRGSGKTLLAECIGHIVTGGAMNVGTYTNDENELRKRITAIAIRGSLLVLLDNLGGFIKNPTLDAALTATHWDDRILGENRMISPPLLATWYASGNNCQLFTDTIRRTCLIRLATDQERPEERNDFKHSDLIRWVGSERPRLLAAAFTILKGSTSAGMPDQKPSPWGSFSGWSDLIRGTIVHAGLTDPGETRTTISNSDPTTEALAMLLELWELADPNRRGLTAGDSLKRFASHRVTMIGQCRHGRQTRGQRSRSYVNAWTADPSSAGCGRIANGWLRVGFSTRRVRAIGPSGGRSIPQVIFQTV